MSYLSDLPGQDAYNGGSLVQPTRRSWNFTGGLEAAYNAATDQIDVTAGGTVYTASGLPASATSGDVALYTDHAWGLLRATFDGTNWRRDKDSCIVPTATTDGAYLQELIDNQGAAGEMARTILLPAKNFDISAPLIIDGVIGLTIQGACACYKDQDALNQTRIRLSDDDEAALVIQGSRSVTLFGLHFQGQNDITDAGTSFVADSYAALMDNANFLVAGVRNNRWSPHAAVAVDPLGTVTDSADRYPSLTDSYDETSTSRELVLEACTFRGFACGVVLSPDEALQLGDSMTFRKCMFRDNYVGFAACQAQNKAVRLEQCFWEYNLICIGTGIYGRQQGYPPYITGGYALQFKYLLMCHANLAPMVIHQLQMEQCLSLGQWGYGFANQASPLFFKDCAIQLQDVDGSDRIEIDFHLAAFGNIHFEGGTLINTSAIEGVLRIHNDRWVSFDRVQLTNELYSGQGFPVAFANEAGGTPATRVRVEDITIFPAGGSQLTERGHITAANGGIVSATVALSQETNYQASFTTAGAVDGQYYEVVGGWTPEQGTDFGFTGQTSFSTNLPIGLGSGGSTDVTLLHVPVSFWTDLDGSNETLTARIYAVSSGNTFAES